MCCGLRILILQTAAKLTNLGNLGKECIVQQIVRKNAI